MESGTASTSASSSSTNLIQANVTCPLEIDVSTHPLAFFAQLQLAAITYGCWTQWINSRTSWIKTPPFTMRTRYPVLSQMQHPQDIHLWSLSSRTMFMRMAVGTMLIGKGVTLSQMTIVSRTGQWRLNHLPIMLQLNLLTEGYLKGSSTIMSVGSCYEEESFLMLRLLKRHKESLIWGQEQVRGYVVITMQTIPAFMAMLFLQRYFTYSFQGSRLCRSVSCGWSHWKWSKCHSTDMGTTEL